ncbi:MAG: hypothetical protein GXO79_04935 [Chlorobi bacterium]|nr:hypothetical protein [Chlorobiota bacterium]
MKKAFRIIYLTICGLLSIGFLLWAVIQSQEAEKQKLMNQEWIKINKELLNNMDEYYNNMILLRNDSLHKIDIDSIFENSICLKDFEHIYKESQEK